ncbi:hypothetical protein JAAARDRAFT_146038 [Jaapia argillacea MUCL 33604]|uniref:t-SNARE coiled-coil homology domain-containing protein n=1 Tax=Jaapia argillacea MUCL 33604 TaxID=933084 RepID=A0A067QFC0_9AGAM|nr:hypothetical protein JAAARDRAFT_146038 [Jaapia argillacea MUCL 33604]
MGAIERTGEFQQSVREKRDLIPEAKRRKLPRPVRRQDEGELLPSKEYVKEAYTILNHISTLTRMLSTIRKPYLSIDSRSVPASLSRQGSRNIDLSAEGGAGVWSGIKHLTNEERDQIDLQARVILSRCADRVKEMEELEKRRSELAASKTNPLTRLLPSRLLPSTSTAHLSSDVIAAHHSSITWYLSRRLAEVSQTQKEMQEERVKRQLERTKTLGSGAAREAASLGLASEGFTAAGGVPKDGNTSWLGSTFASGLAATIGAPDPSSSSQHTLRPGSSHANPSPPLTASTTSDLDSDLGLDEELTQSQILQFESENSAILESVQSTLHSVQQAESRLLEISALQTELVANLTRQTELTDQLYEDAMTSTGMVEKGNEQLKEARRRAKDSRLFILVFLIGASLSLLFLHYY